MKTISRTKIQQNTKTRAYDLLGLIALSGEFPKRMLPRIPGGKSYTEKLVTELKKQGLLKTVYHDKQRGLRLTVTAKKLLLAENPERFAFCFEENADTNHIRSDINRRVRLHRVAEIILAMSNAGIPVFRDEIPLAFSPTFEGDECISAPAFYTSREMKGLGEMFTKAKGSRSMGVLLTEQDIFIVYNLYNSVVKWKRKSEMKLKTLLEYILCQSRYPKQYFDSDIKAVAFGNTMDVAFNVLTSARRNSFILDENYNNFYFLTNDDRGEMLLYLLCHREIMQQINDILTVGMYPADNCFTVDNDAITEDGVPVLLAYTCDLKRIQKFTQSLTMYKTQGIMFCFDYQAEILRRYCKDWVDIRTLDYEKTKRRFYKKT